MKPTSSLRSFRSSRAALVLAFLSFGTSNSFAIGLEPLYQEARQSDPQYAAAKADWESVQSLVTQARGQLLPQISASGSSIRSTTVNEFRNASTGDVINKDYKYTAKSASLSLSQALIRPQTIINYTQSLAQVRQADEQLNYYRQDLILRLSQAYFDVLLAEDNVSLAAEQMAAISEQLKQAKRFFEAGVGTITDINEAQARYDTITAQELAAQNNLEIKIRVIEQFVGKAYRSIDRLGNRLALELPEPANVENWLEFAQENNPALKAREAALNVSEQEVYKSLAAHLPTVDLVASRGRDQDPSFTMIDSATWNNRIGLQVSIPLFSGGTTQGRANQASANKEKSRHDLETTRRSVTLQTRQEYLNVVNGVAQVKALEQAVKSNELALYSAKKGQEAGVRTSFDVLNAQQLLFSAKRDLSQARYGYVLSRLKLRGAAGLLSEEDVTLVQHWLEARNH